MKASKLAILLGLGASLVSFASASDDSAQAYLASYRKAPGVPVPVSVVTPRVSEPSIGQQVEVEFTVTTSGRPEGVTVVSTTDANLADDVVDAVKQWQFAPATKNGVPVETKVILPVRVVPSTTNSFAVN